MLPFSRYGNVSCRKEIPVRRNAPAQRGKNVPPLSRKRVSRHAGTGCAESRASGVSSIGKCTSAANTPNPAAINHAKV